MSAAGWFNEWLSFHKTVNPHARFRVYEEAGFDLVYAGWINVFDARGIDQEEANGASQAMQAEDKRELYPEHHLARILVLVTQAKARENRASSDEEARRAAARQQQQKIDDRQAAIKRAWAKLDPSTQDRHRQKVIQANPGLARFNLMIEQLARNEWASEVKSRRRALAP